MLQLPFSNSKHISDQVWPVTAVFFINSTLELPKHVQIESLFEATVVILKVWLGGSSSSSELEGTESWNQVGLSFRQLVLEMNAQCIRKGKK